jgi:signal peptidase I
LRAAHWFGDHIFVDKLAYRLRAPRRGEVMAFAFPERREQDFVKRVIAVSGDTLEARDGRPFINGWRVPSCRVGAFSYVDVGQVHTGELEVEFLEDHSYLAFYDTTGGAFPDRQGPFHAENGEVWVMGDNRNDSYDSRMWFHGDGGGVPRALLRGPAFVVWMSISDVAVDWSRYGQTVDAPHLPKGSEALQPALDECMKKRPARSETEPPAPAAGLAGPR